MANLDSPSRDSDEKSQDNLDEEETLASGSALAHHSVTFN